MKITDIRTAVVKANFEWILVRVYTDEGIVGLGEANPVRANGLHQYIHDYLKPRLIGQDPRDIDRLFNRMVERNVVGPAVAAASGVEMALWDILGQSLGVPIYRLLGGKYRDKVRIYADTHGGDVDSPESWHERAKEVVVKGFTGLKFDIDHTVPQYNVDPANRAISSLELSRMVELVAAVREAVGPGVEFALDCHNAFNTNDAIRLACALEPYNLWWLEDPVPDGNADALAKVTSSTKTTICFGEDLYTRWGFKEVITKQAADIIQPDIQKTGGLLEVKKIADFADTYFIPVVMHDTTSPIGTMHACHVSASIRNFIALEFHQQYLSWWDDMIVGPKLIQQSYVTLPDKPGLGIELNEDTVRAHLKPGTTFFAED